ncbi:MAG: hypothetical protein HQ501_08650 [Rhodospirillales bacterium]|nr:hypothetical protein [Rhodospirillales bacterium]
MTAAGVRATVDVAARDAAYRDLRILEVSSVLRINGPQLVFDDVRGVTVPDAVMTGRIAPSCGGWNHYPGIRIP